jgi:hypothetical protein
MKRLIVSLILFSASPLFAQSKFEPTYRAGKTLQIAIDNGVAYAKFNELLQAFATEISIAQDKSTTDAEKAVVLLFDDSLAGYKDSKALWDCQLQVGRMEGYDDQWKRNGQPIILDRKILRKDWAKVFAEICPTIPKILEKYSLPTENIKPNYADSWTVVRNGVPAVWKVAADRLDKANKTYNASQQ